MTLIDNRMSSKIMLCVAAALFLSLIYLFLLFKTNAFYDLDMSSLVDDTYIAWTPTMAIEVAKAPEKIQESFEQSSSQVNIPEGGHTPTVSIPGSTQVPTVNTAIDQSGNTSSSSSSAAKVASYLKGLGYNNVAAAGIMGNMEAESGMSSVVTQGHKHDGQLVASCSRPAGGDGHGLVQWDGGRRVNLIAYAQGKGKEWWDFDTQLDFFKSEVTGSEKMGGGVDALNALASVQAACLHFSKYYERCAGAPQASQADPTPIHRWEVRLENSEKYYKYLQTNARQSGGA